jgi:hypothetical protein
MRDSHYAQSAGFDSVFKHSLGDAMAAGRWQDLVANMGADVAESVRGTLASITELLQSKKIGASEALWLQTPLKRLYQAGLAAQRLSRLADHPRMTAAEAVKLDDLVADCVIHHQKRSRSHRIGVELCPLEVMAQPEALAAAVDSLFLWGMRLGRVLNIRMIKAPHLPSGELWLRIEALNRGAHEERNLNSVDWHVLWQLARLKAVKVKRKVEDDRIRVQIKFNRVMSQHSGFAVLEYGLEDDEPAFDTQRTSVWCVIPRSHVSALVIQTLRPHMPNLEAVADLRALTHDGRDPPDCIVSVPDVVDTDEFRRWRRKAQEATGRTIAVVEITSEPNIFDIGGLGSRAVARLSADSISSKLLSALVFELSQLNVDVH